jgi:hypothetical protein
MTNIVELPLTSTAKEQRNTFYLDADSLACTEVDAPPSYVASIAKLGQLVPILVTQGEDGSYTVTEGLRRVAAIKVINELQLPADDPLQVLCVDAMCEAGDEPLVTLSANLVRARNAPAEADAVMALVDSGKTTKEIAKDLGVSARQIHDLYELRRGLHKAAWTAFAQGRMAPSTAKRMLTLEKKVQASIVKDNPTKITGKAVNASRKDQYLDMMNKLPSVTSEASNWGYQLLANKLQMLTEDAEIRISTEDVTAINAVVNILKAL